MNVFENFGVSGGGGGGRIERVALMNTRATDIVWLASYERGPISPSSKSS